MNWKKLDIMKKEMIMKLGIQISNKREPVFKNGSWVDTIPLIVSNVDNLFNVKNQNRALKYKLNKVIEENSLLKEKLQEKTLLIDENQEKLSSTDSLQTRKYIDNKPTLFKNKMKKKKKKPGA